MAESEWKEGRLNYEGPRVDYRVVSEHVYNSAEERVDGMEKLQEETKYSTWAVWDRKMDGKHKYFFQIHECKLVDLPKGYMVPFPWVEMAYNHDKIIDQIFYDPEIDLYIEDILIKFNQLGIGTWSSCSGLLEDHIYVIPYDEMCEPFVLFDNIKDLDKVRSLIKNTQWKINMRMFENVKEPKPMPDFSIRSSIDGDKNILKLWDSLRDRLCEL